MGAGHGGLIGTMNSRSSNAGLRLGDVFTASEVDVVRKEAERDLPHCNGFRRDGTPARCVRCCPTDDWRADGILTRASIR
jgi:hypothetical protein